MGGLDLQRPPVPLDRPGGVVEPRAQRVAQAGQPIGVHPPIDARAPREKLAQLGEAAALGEQLDQRVDAFVVLAEAGRDLAPGVHGARQIARPRVGQGRDLDEIGARLVRARARCPRDGATAR